MAEEEKVKEGEDNSDKKKLPTPKTIVEYISAGEKSRFSAIFVDAKGKITKTTADGDKALKEFKKFVSAL